MDTTPRRRAARGARPRRTTLEARRTADDLEVETCTGTVRGVAERGRISWRGIPYAAAPVGPLRFRSPRPADGWQGVRDATEYGPVAPQAVRGQFKSVGPRVPMSEDCLSINVTVAEGVPRRDLPVVVYIHAGGYSAGSSRGAFAEGAALADEGAVLYVGFNYRLGPLGFLDFSRYSTPDRPFDTNLGLRDQVAALRWVRDNIAAFGGDPDNVTLLGESSGANSITTLLAVPSAAGLFARAIAQSPPVDAVYPRALAEAWSAQFLALLAAAVPEPQPDPARLLDTASPDQLLAASLVLQRRVAESHPGTFPLAPIVDGELVPERPLTAMREGRAARVPLIIGSNAKEGAVFRGRIDILPRTRARMRSLFERAPAQARSVMLRSYRGLPRRGPAAQFGGDFGFWYPSVKAADLHSRFAEVHAYRFDAAPRLLRLIGLGATHGVEMFALFDRTRTPLGRLAVPVGGVGAFRRVGARMRRAWISFITDGTLPPGWPAYDEQHRRTLILDTVDRVAADPRRARRLAWDRFLPEA
jgi:para-nitrobenzyl esterase